MNTSPFPISKWGDVKRQPDGSKVERVRIDASGGSGFLILTKEPNGTFDVWVETEDDVVDYLSSLEVEWER